MEVGCARRFITIEVGGMDSREKFPVAPQNVEKAKQLTRVSILSLLRD